MPKHNLANTIIYKLQCKSDSSKFIFGYTGNVKCFKCNLKRDCNANKQTTMHSIIKLNGGYDNWEFVIVEPVTDCKCIRDAEKYVENAKRRHIESQMNPNESHLTQNESLTCEYCNKEFTFRTNLVRHQKKSCKNKQPDERELLLQKQIELQQEEIKLLKQQQSQIITNNTNNTNNTNSHNNNCNNTNNNTINNTQNNIIIELGNEDLVNVLSEQQKIAILNKLYDSINCLTEYIHCNPTKFPQFRNVSLTSLTKSKCQMYSQKKKKFITKNINTIIDKLVMYRTIDLEAFLENAVKNGTVDKKTETAVRGLVEKMDNDAKYKKQKIDEIKCVMYDSSK